MNNHRVCPSCKILRSSFSIGARVVSNRCGTSGHVERLCVQCSSRPMWICVRQFLRQVSLFVCMHFTLASFQICAGFKIATGLMPFARGLKLQFGPIVAPSPLLVSVQILFLILSWRRCIHPRSSCSLTKSLVNLQSSWLSKNSPPKFVIATGMSVAHL
jgi:hypothetical protein